MFKRRKRILLCSVVISIIMMIFFVVQGFESSKAINIYTAIEEEYISEYIKAFNKKYPDIKVNIIRDSSGVVASKLLVEKDNPRADIIWGVPASNALILEKYNIFEPYKSKNLEKLDETFYDTKNSVPNWVGISAWMTAFTVNTVELEKRGLPVPNSYEDLLNPVYKKSIIMPNPSSSGTGFLTVSAFLQLFGEKGWSYMDKLNPNIAEYSHSGSAPTKQVAKGEALIGVGMDFLSLQSEKDNPQVKTILPKEGSGWEVEVLGLVKKEKIKDGAKIFYDWAISDEAMNLYAKNRSMVTTKGFKPAQSEKYPVGVKEQMIENNFSWASENRNDILKKWDEKYGVGE